MEDDMSCVFTRGHLALPGRTVDFETAAWEKHPICAGVWLKRLVGSDESGGAFSFHLVRIEPGMAIQAHTHGQQIETHEVAAGNGFCRNGETELPYRPGVISIFPKGAVHEVRAGEEGLLLLAKFMPALS